MEFRIDPEFRDVLPTSEERYKALEAVVLNDGMFTDPFVTWNGILLDGHTRYRIMQNHPELDLKPFEQKLPNDRFSDRYAAIVWIIKRQTERRNLNDFELAEAHKKAFDAQKKTQGGQAGNTNAEKRMVANDQSFSRNKDGATTTILAADFGIKPGQFKHSVRIGNAMEEAERLVPGAKEVIKSGKAKVSKTALEDMHLIESEDERREFVEAIVRGEKVESPRKHKDSGKESKKNADAIRQIAEQMRSGENRADFDDVLRILNSLEDDFINKLRRTFENDNAILTSDERWPEAIEGFFDSVMEDVEKLKGEILK